MQLSSRVLGRDRTSFRSIYRREVERGVARYRPAPIVFGPNGELVSFHSEDRYQSMDGKTFRRLPWSMPLREYRDFAGARRAGAGEAVWHTPAGEFVYIRMEMLAIEYNVDSVSNR